MKIISSIKEIRGFIENNKNINKKVSLIPTMGNLHDGHISLIEEAKKRHNIIVVSIFVNPLQFNDQQDYNNYPKTLDNDINILSDNAIDCLFIPEKDEIIKENFLKINLPWGFNNMLCGKFRKNHFEGVYYIVKELFDIINPDYVFFGEKDYQQSTLIKYLIKNDFKNIMLVICPTKRDSNGLALSSRNNLIDKNILIQTSKIFNKIKDTCVQYYKKTGLKDFEKFYIFNDIFETEYVHIYNDSLFDKKHGITDVSTKKHYDDRIFVALKVNDVRLIDNQIIREYN